MADDDFSFDDNEKGDDDGFSLDDFFGGDEKKSGESEGGGPSIDDFFGSTDESQPDDSLPMDRQQAQETPPPGGGGGEAPAPDPFAAETPEAGPAPAEPDFSEERTEPPPEAELGEEATESEGGGFLARNWLLLVIGVLAILVVGSGGFLGYTYFFGDGGKPLTQKTIPAAADKDRDQKKDQEKEKKKPSEKAADKKAKKAAVSVGTDVEKEKAPDKKAAATKKKKESEKESEKEKKEPAGGGKSPSSKKAEPDSPSKKPEKKSAEPKEPEKKVAKAGHQPVKSTGGPYTVQVASYMMDASKKKPESKLKELGYNDYHYVKEHRRLWKHNVYAGEDLSRKKARQIVDKLEDMGYAPRMERHGQGYRVLVYSYGSKSVANSTRRKVARAGVQPVKVESEKKKADLDQLRVGHFSSRYKARKAQQDLRRNGFRSAYVVRE
ncbi:MAG: SPOR domain-containing protein [bacterium]